MRNLPHHYWHTLPLHYLPHLLYTDALCSQAELKRRGYSIIARRSAARRDRKLHLDDFVHLSPVANTPLLRDKCQRGYPHVLIAFDAALLNEVAPVLCRYNAKSWRHREDFAPVVDAEAQSMVWTEWQAGKFPSLEVLVPQVLPVRKYASTLHLPDDMARDWLGGFDAVLPGTPSALCLVSPHLFPELARYEMAPLDTYRETCRAAKQVLPPPDLPFD